MTGTPTAPALPDESTVPVPHAWMRLLFARADLDAERKACEAMMASIEHSLHMASALARSGRPVDLGGLENWVGRLTAATLDLEPPDGRRLRPRMIALLSRLDRLEHAMRSRAPPQGGST